MQKFYSSIGGRKFLLILISMGLLVFKNQLGLDTETIDKIMIAAIGGSSTIAAVDIAEVLKSKKRGRK